MEYTDIDEEHAAAVAVVHANMYTYLRIKFIVRMFEFSASVWGQWTWWL